MKTFLKNIAVVASAIAATLAICLGILAWSEPSATPPEGNIAAPINTGSTQQTKTGPLGIKLNTLGYWISQVGQSLAFFNSDTDGNSKTAQMVIGQDGNVGIGTQTPDKKLVVGGAAQANQFCLNGKCCSTWEECAGSGGTEPTTGDCFNGISKGIYGGWYLNGYNYSSGSCSSGEILSGGVCCPAGYCNWSGYCLRNGCVNGNYNNSVCRNGVWKMNIGGNCQGGWQCDKGTCSNGICTLAPKQCVGNADCGSAGVCSYGICCLAGECGYNNQCVGNKSFANDSSFSGVCLNGQWFTVPGGKGCDTYPCDAGFCVNNNCAYKQCENNSDCSGVGVCSAGICCQVGGCGISLEYNGFHSYAGTNPAASDANRLRCLGNGEKLGYYYRSGSMTGGGTTYVCKNGVLSGNQYEKCDKGTFLRGVCVYTQCASDADCFHYSKGTGECKSGVCCQAGECIMGGKCSANGERNNPYSSSGPICRNGVWKTDIYSYGCDIYPCDQGTCKYNQCTY